MIGFKRDKNGGEEGEEDLIDSCFYTLQPNPNGLVKTIIRTHEKIDNNTQEKKMPSHTRIRH
jgi:hypothetical protein